MLVCCNLVFWYGGALPNRVCGAEKLEVKELPEAIKRFGKIELIDKTTEYRRDGNLVATWVIAINSGALFGTEIRFFCDGDLVCKVGGNVNVTVMSKVGVYVDRQEEGDGFRVWVLIPERNYFEYVEIFGKEDPVCKVLDGEERATEHKSYLGLTKDNAQNSVKESESGTEEEKQGTRTSK